MVAAKHSQGLLAARRTVRILTQPGGSYAAGVVERDSVVEPEPWGEDPKLVALLGEQARRSFRALFDGFPEAVGVLLGPAGRRRADRRLHGCRPRRGIATRCWRRCRGCAAVAPST